MSLEAKVWTIYIFSQVSELNLLKSTCDILFDPMCRWVHFKVTNLVHLYKVRILKTRVNTSDDLDKFILLMTKLFTWIPFVTNSQKVQIQTWRNASEIYLNIQETNFFIISKRNQIEKADFSLKV